MQSGFIPFIRKGKIEPVLGGLLVTRQSPKEQGWLGFFWGEEVLFVFFFPGGERMRRNFGLLKMKKKAGN